MMGAIEFVKEYLRMCIKVDDCENCPVYKTDFCTVPAKERSQESAEEIVALVEEWAAAHPRKTRQSVFLEQWPEAWTYADGVLSICPNKVADWHRGAAGECIDGAKMCEDCRREFWMQEVE